MHSSQTLIINDLQRRFHVPFRHADRTEADELFGFILDGESEARELAVLWRASIDDNADRNREKVVISACLLGDCQQWREIARPWKIKLAEYNLKYFNSSECGLLNGEFFQFRSDQLYPKPLGRKTADKVRDELEEIIKNSKVCGFGVVIPVPVFHKIYAEPHYAAVISSPDPYELAVQILWDQCAKGMKELGRNHIVISRTMTGTITAACGNYF